MKAERRDALKPLCVCVFYLFIYLFFTFGLYALQGRTRNSVREKCGKWKNWEILPYLKIPKKSSDRFSLKNVYVSVLVLSVNSKNLNIGCTARFGEIKQEKIVIATSACLFWENPGFQRARAPTGEYVLSSCSNIRHKITTLQSL